MKITITVVNQPQPSRGRKGRKRKVDEVGIEESSTAMTSPPNRSSLPWAEDEALLLEWLEDPTNCALYKGTGLVTGKIGTSGTTKTRIYKTIATYLQHCGCSRSPLSIKNKLRDLEAGFKKALEYLSQNKSGYPYPKPDTVEAKMASHRDAVLSMCPQWDRLHVIFSDFPHLTPLSASSSEIHPNDDAEEEGSITESVEPTQTPRRQVLNSSQVLNSDAQKKPLPIMANHSPGMLFKMDRDSFSRIAPHPREAPMQLVIPRSSIELWCAVCETFMDGPCVLHTKSIKDEQLLAYATLPKDLVISQSDKNHPDDRRVLTNVDILEPTVFGPLVGTLVHCREDLLSDVKYVLAVAENGLVTTRYFCLNSDDDCNWMKFVRLVKQPSEANLIVFQQQGNVYFSTFKPVKAGEELVVIYSTHYARTVEEATNKLADTELNKVPDHSFMRSRTITHRRPASSLVGSQSVLDVLSAIPALPNFLPGEEEVNFPLDTGTLPSELVLAADDSLLSLEKSVRPPKRPKREKPTLRKFARKNHKLETVITELFSEDEPVRSHVPEPHYEDSNDSGSDGLPEVNTKKKKPSEKEVSKPKRGKGVDMAKTKKRKVKVLGREERVVNEGKVEKDDRLHVSRQRAKARAGKFSAWYPYATFACDQCDAHYREEALLNIHGISHGKVFESPPSLICPSCDMVCLSVDDLLDHIKKHQRRVALKLPKVTEFQCKICKQCYDTDAVLQRHVKVVHPPGGRRMVTYDDGAKHPCPKCQKECLTPAGMAAHQRVHRGEFQQCIICLELLTSLKKVQLHAIEKHQVDGIFQCLLCERTCADYNLLKRHISHVHQPRNLACDKCPKMFCTKIQLKKHYLCHQNEYAYQCQTCGRKFKRKKNYDGHMQRLHKTDRVYKMKERSEKIANAFAKALICEYCTRQYQNKKRLLMHQREKHLELLPCELRIDIGDKTDDATSRSSASEESDG